MDWLDYKTIDFQHNKQLDPLQIMCLKLRNTLPSFITYEQILNIFSSIESPLESSVILETIVSDGTMLECRTWANYILRTERKMIMTENGCSFCYSQNKCAHGKYIYNVSLIEQNPYKLHNLCNINNACIRYFISTTLLAPFYKQYCILLTCDHLPKDIIRYIGHIILTHCLRFL